MKRIAWILGVAILAAAALLTLGVALLPREDLKFRLGQQIAAWTGRDVSLRGEPELDLFPTLTVTLNDVQVGGPAGMPDSAIISMDRLTGTVRLLPLVIGRVEIASFTMVRPLIRLVRDAEGARNWAFDSGAAALQLAFAGDVPLGDFIVEDGTIVYENRQRQAAEQLDSVNLAIAWPSVRQALLVTGSAIWRGEQVAVSGSAEEPFEFVNGDTTPLNLQVQSAPISMSFTGAAGDISSPQLRGALSMTTPSLRGFARWLGSPVGPGSTLGASSLAGNAVFRESVLSVEDAELALDGNRATGALEIAVRTTPEVTGTLAMRALDLTAYFGGTADARGPARGWRDTVLQTDWFRQIRADIRLSADSVAAGPLRFGQTAASVSVRDGRLEIGVAEAAFYGGSLAGDVSIADAAEGPGATLRSDLRATGFDLSAVAAPLRSPHALSGRASVAANLASAGPNLGAVVAGLTGTGRIDIAGGSVPLFGIAEIAAGPGGGAPPSSALTAVDSVFAGLSFSGGTAVVEQSTIRAPGFSADAKGWIVLGTGSVGLNGTVQPADASAPIAFTIDGTLAQPTARPLALAN